MKLYNDGHITRRLLTAREAAHRLGISTKTLWEWVHKGIIPQVVLPGRNARYDIEDLDRIIDQHKSYNLMQAELKDVISGKNNGKQNSA